MFKTILPRRLIRLREIHGLTQRALAEKSGVSLSGLNFIESGLAVDLKLSTLLSLARALSTSPDALLGLEIPSPEKSCRFCCHVLQSGGDPHGYGECVYLLWNSGRQAAFIAARLGLTVGSIDHILRDELRIRRRRPVEGSTRDG